MDDREPDLSEQLRQEQETNLLLVETIADLELAAENRGWDRLTGDSQSEFTGSARRAIVTLSRSMAIANPLVKRGVMLRIAYIWGGGVELAARDQDVQDVVQAFWDDNARSLSSSQAQEELERALATDGNVYLAAFTNPLTGRVQVRSLPTDEICDVVSNPDDKDEPWFYVREYTRRSLGADAATVGGTQTVTEVVKEVYPALGYTPAQRIKNLDGAAVKWDAPLLHVAVNRLDGWTYGVPDVYASTPWARAYKDFLTDWSLLTKSLAKFAWRAVGDTKSRANKAITAIRNNVAASAPTAQPTADGMAGAVIGQTSGVSLEAIPKSGATIDAESGKPLAAMVAAGLGVPVTLLLADPGVTGARAVAETLDAPTALEMGMRRLLWQGQLSRLLDYVIDQAALSPRNPLRGTAKVDSWGRRVVELPKDKPRTVDWNWPELGGVDPLVLVNAIVAANTTGLLPDEPVIRLLLNALGVEDVDEIIDDMKDSSGNIVRPEMNAGQAAVDAFNRGQDPAAQLGGGGGAPKAREVAEGDRVFHWKHGWIPLDHVDAPAATGARRWTGTHVTLHAEDIRQHGFDLNKSGGWVQKFGRGVYIGTGENDRSAFYTKQKGAGAETLHVAADLQHTAVVDADKRGSYIPSDPVTLLETIPGYVEKRKELLDAYKAEYERRGGFAKSTTDDHFYDNWPVGIPQSPSIDPAEILAALGYDSLHIKQKNFTKLVGGDQLIVFDPSKVKLRKTPPGDGRKPQ